MPGLRKAELEALAARLDYHFQDPALLKQALTHASGATGRASYERLEFLGDRVLGLVIAEELFRRHPATREGSLSAQLSVLVRREACATAARDIGLDEFIRLGRKEASAGLQQNTTVLGDAMEAVIAAIYQDGGLDAARGVILRLWHKQLEIAGTLPKDPKTFLQEWALGRGLPIPAYRERSREGPDHLPVFEMEVSLPGFEPSVGTAPSKRAAEYEAAERFLRREHIRT